MDSLLLAPRRWHHAIAISLALALSFSLVSADFCKSLPSTPTTDDDGPPLTPTDALGPFYIPSTPQRRIIAPLEQLSDPENVLHMEGQVLGNDCVPMANVMVEPWYAGLPDANGNAYSPPESENLNYRGTLFTDSCGYYKFTQSFPILYADRPIHHVHFRLSHSNNKNNSSSSSSSSSTNNQWSTPASNSFNQPDRVLLVTQMYFQDLIPTRYNPDATQIVTVETNTDRSRSAVFNIYVDQPGTANVTECGLVILPDDGDAPIISDTASNDTINNNSDDNNNKNNNANNADDETTGQQGPRNDRISADTSASSRWFSVLCSVVFSGLLLLSSLY